LLAEYRSTDVISPRLSTHEALAGVIDHFAKVIARQEKSIMDGLSGIRIIEILEAAQRALDESLEHTRQVGANRTRAVTS
jgi:hypothetical protein